MTRFVTMALATLIAASLSSAAPVDETISYQGTLTNSGLANLSTADLRFRLYSEPIAGSLVGSEIELLGVPISDGLFNVKLDFGIKAFGALTRWIEIDAREPGGGYTTLIPRQEVLGAPYSVQTRGIVVNSNNNVGIGTSVPLYPLDVRSDTGTAIYGSTDSPTGRGLHGTAFSGSGETAGVRGVSISTAGRGVYGLANNPSGTNYGGYFQSDSTDGTGVYGVASHTSGNTTGVYGQNNSTIGHAVFGWATADTGTSNGVYGLSSSTGGRAVLGWATSSSGNTYGVYGTVSSTSGIGVYGRASASSGLNYGVVGETKSTSGRGVYGKATASSGIAYGVVGETNSTSGRGVYGEATASSGIAYGVVGESLSTSGRGVRGVASASSGNTYGVHGISDSTGGRGVYGVGAANSGVNYGVVGQSFSASGFDFYASGAGTNYGSSSSKRWKNNVRSIDAPLDKLTALRGVYFDWDDDHGGHHDLGFIAEDVGAVMPEIVQYEENGVDAIGMDYSKMTPLLVEAVNALRAEKDGEIQQLRYENELLKARLDHIEQMMTLAVDN